jgi:hypothetical protein
MSSYNYSISADTSNALLNNEVLASSVVSSTINKSLQDIKSDGDTLSVVFESALSTEEQATLDALIAAHDGTPSPEIAELEIDDDGRQVTKTATTYKGWRYLAHVIEVETAKLNGIFSANWDGSSRTDFEMKFYDDQDAELVAGTQAELDSDCVKTVITIAPSHDYDIIGGNIHQHTTPTENIRLWVIAGATDLAHVPGTVKEFVGGLNMKFMGINEQIETDGRASARLNLETEGLPVPTNKMQYIITHPAGHQHELMIVLEYFRQ